VKEAEISEEIPEDFQEEELLQEILEEEITDLDNKKEFGYNKNIKLINIFLVLLVS
jgi:hypothetical protein